MQIPNEQQQRLSGWAINYPPPPSRSLTAFPYVSVTLNFTNWSCIEYIEYIEYIQFQDIITHVTEIDQSYYGF